MFVQRTLSFKQSVFQSPDHGLLLTINRRDPHTSGLFAMTFLNFKLYSQKLAD